MEIFTSKKDCCGCSACQAICPKNAISMKPDEEGFLYPEINNDKCVECGACKKICAFQNGYIKNHTQSAYAVKHKDLNTRMTSRSGGVFIALSDYILEKGGAVYGTAFSGDFSVCHIRATTKNERDKMKGSKYVQSQMNDIFSQVKNDLNNGLFVLFSGTGCQVGGLTKYLSNCDTSKLFTCDLVCHGVPSPKIWKEFVDLKKKQYGSNIEKIDFRDKTLGWACHKEAFIVDGKKHLSNEYAYLFMSSQIIRQSCFNCKYTNLDRPSDFTLGDFWGIQKIAPEFSDDKGVSLLLVNSEKGEKLFSKVNNDIDFISCDIDKSSQPNPNLSAPTLCPNNREDFWNIYYKNGFEYAMKKYYEKEKRRKNRNRVSDKIKKIFRK